MKRKSVVYYVTITASVQHRRDLEGNWVKVEPPPLDQQVKVPRSINDVQQELLLSGALLYPGKALYHIINHVGNSWGGGISRGDGEGEVTCMERGRWVVGRMY